MRKKREKMCGQFCSCGCSVHDACVGIRIATWQNSTTIRARSQLGGCSSEVLPHLPELSGLSISGWFSQARLNGEWSASPSGVTTPAKVRQSSNLARIREGSTLSLGLNRVLEIHVITLEEGERVDTLCRRSRPNTTLKRSAG